MGSGQPDYAGTILGPRVVPATNERRTTVFNDSDIVSGAPPLNRSAIDYGKFFPRGMRGTLEEIPIYCLGNAVNTLKVSISPYPGLGPTYTVTITPPAVWGWVNAAFNVMWNYDSMYVWISACNAAVFWGYDNTVKPFDGHHTADSGATFTDLDERYFFRIVMTGETAGDVPVSGIVNNVPIPYSSTKFLFAYPAIPMGVETFVVGVDGAGYCDLIIFRPNIAAHSDHTVMLVYCDGDLVFETGFVEALNFGYTTSTPRISLTTHAVDGTCVLLISKRFEFRRNFHVNAYNGTGPAIANCRIYPTLLR